MPGLIVLFSNCSSGPLYLACRGCLEFLVTQLYPLYTLVCRHAVVDFLYSFPFLSFLVSATICDYVAYLLVYYLFSSIRL